MKGPSGAHTLGSVSDWFVPPVPARASRVCDLFGVLKDSTGRDEKLRPRHCLHSPDKSTENRAAKLDRGGSGGDEILRHRTGLPDGLPRERSYRGPEALQKRVRRVDLYDQGPASHVPPNNCVDSADHLNPKERGPGGRDGGPGNERRREKFFGDIGSVVIHRHRLNDRIEPERLSPADPPALQQLAEVAPVGLTGGTSRSRRIRGSRGRHQ